MENKKLITFRQEKKLSLIEIANKIGISKSYYEKIEYGDRTPSYNFLNKFKLAFPDASVEDIFLNNNHTICV
jgi:putative transcriptional regulator